jgi:hypothetical protein
MAMTPPAGAGRRHNYTLFQGGLKDQTKNLRQLGINWPSMAKKVARPKALGRLKDGP